MEVTVKSLSGSVRIRDGRATIGETTLGDILAAATETLQAVATGEPAVEIKLPFGFSGVGEEVDDDE